MSEALHYHTETIEGSERCQCEFCDHWATDRALFAQHMQQHHDVTLPAEDEPTTEDGAAQARAQRTAHRAEHRAVPDALPKQATRPTAQFTPKMPESASTAEREKGTTA